MTESAATDAFLKGLAKDLKSKLGHEYLIERKYRSITDRAKSQGFEYDIAISSRDRSKLILIEIEIGGKAPIYNLMKTIYWLTLYKDNRPQKVMFLHVFTTNPTKRSYDVRQDLTNFADQMLIKKLFEYKHIYFPMLSELRMVTTGEYVSKTGEPTAELKRREQEAILEVIRTKEGASAGQIRQLKKAVTAVAMREKDMKDSKMKVVERVISEIVPKLSEKIILNISKW